MRLTNRGRGLVAGLIVSTVGVMGYSFHEGAQEVGDCTVMMAGTVSDQQWDGLVQGGWRGNPNDGMEALWSPECTDAAIATNIALMHGAMDNDPEPTWEPGYLPSGALGRVAPRCMTNC